ncbi:tripartite motif-containing protein 65 [Astyanax mexicanus]|uniref:tripartite motif-containing protein 65 n=1 Tax=Astyanax mexicanus TaxID=7994 RepID=UPI0020CB322D|nr:tripartite motif-containing protein 65 [Astyanax mexicanus]
MSTVYEDIVKLVANNLKCSICFELFTDPVTLSCGHNYCLNCIQRYLSRGTRTCPQCRSKLPHTPNLKKNVALSNILDLQEAGGREMWNQVVIRTDQCNSYHTEKLTEDGSLSVGKNISTAKGFSSSFDNEGGSQCADSSSSSLEFSELENSINGFSRIEALESMLPDPDSDAQEVSEVLLDGLNEASGLADFATADLNCSQSAEFVLLSFLPAMGHRRLAFMPENRRLVVRSAFSSVTQNGRFDACQWMADQELSRGRHYWDVDVSRCSGWAAGVAYPGLARNEQLGRGPSSWCIERSSGRLSAWHNKKETPLKQDCPDSVRVLLDMDSSCLSFWSLMDGLVELYSVQADFRGPVRPVFWLHGTQQRNVLAFPAR